MDVTGSAMASEALGRSEEGLAAATGLDSGAVK
jgi:hypothetical protein